MVKCIGINDQAKSELLVSYAIIISIGPDIGTTLNNNSKILKIKDNEVVFTYNLNDDSQKKRLIVKSENKDIHFKVEDIN